MGGGNRPQDLKMYLRPVNRFLHDFFSLKCSLGFKTHVINIIGHETIRGRT